MITQVVLIQLRLMVVSLWPIVTIVTMYMFSVGFVTLKFQNKYPSITVSYQQAVQFSFLIFETMHMLASIPLTSMFLSFDTIFITCGVQLSHYRCKMSRITGCLPPSFTFV